MRTFVPLAQLGCRAAVGVALGFDEVLEIGLHGYCLKPSPSTLTNVCCAGFYNFAHPGYRWEQNSMPTAQLSCEMQIGLVSPVKAGI